MATTPPPFQIGVYSQQRGSIAKWKARGINVFLENEFEKRADGTPTVGKSDWEKACADGGMFFYDRPGDTAAIPVEAAQPWRLGWTQDDELDRRKVQLADPDGPIERWSKVASFLKPGQLDMVMNLTAFDNEWYAGQPEPAKQNPGHRADLGGYLKYATIPSFDYYLWNTGRANMFFIHDRMMKRQSDWSVGGACRVAFFIECSNQGLTSPGARGPTLYEMETLILHNLLFCAKNGIKVAGLWYFPQKAKGGFVYDNTPPEIAEWMPEFHKKLLTAAVVQTSGQNPIYTPPPVVNPIPPEPEPPIPVPPSEQDILDVIAKTSWKLTPQ